MTPHETSFKLTKDYLAESFDQSLPHGGHAKPNFIFPAALFVVGIFLLWLRINRTLPAGYLSRCVS